MLDTFVINKCVLRTLSLNIGKFEKLRSPANKQVDGLYIKIENGKVVNVATDSLYIHKASASLSDIYNDESMLGISGNVIIPFESLRCYFKLADLDITSNGDWVFINRVVWESWCRLSKMPAYISGHYVDYNKATNKSFKKTGLKLYRWLINIINTHSIAFDSYYFYKYKPTQEVYLFGVVKKGDRFKITRISYVAKYPGGEVAETIKMKYCFLNPSHLVGFNGKGVEVEICDDAFNFRMDYIPKEHTDSNVVSIFKNYTKDEEQTIKRMCKELLEGKEA